MQLLWPRVLHALQLQAVTQWESCVDLREYPSPTHKEQQKNLGSPCAGGLVAPNMPPSSAVTVAALCEGRLDSGLKLLSQAVASGWRQDGHMATDPDLKAMRELRFTRFERVRQLCQAMD